MAIREMRICDTPNCGAPIVGDQPHNCCVCQQDFCKAHQGAPINLLFLGNSVVEAPVWTCSTCMHTGKTFSREQAEQFQAEIARILAPLYPGCLDVLRAAIGRARLAGPPPDRPDPNPGAYTATTVRRTQQRPPATTTDLRKLLEAAAIKASGS